MGGSDLSALAPTGAVGVALLAHVLRYAYGQGRTHARLSALEHSHVDVGQARELMAALTATVGGLKDSVDGLHDAVREIRGHLFQARGPQ